MKTELLDKWVGGKLLAFSGIDGQTDFQNELIARTNFTNTGITFKLPGECKVIFDDSLPDSCQFASDNFELTVRDGRVVKFAFVDPRHILISGNCKIENHSENISVIREGDKILIGNSKHIDKSKIAGDMDTIMAERREWLNTLSLPDGLDECGRLTLSGAFSQMKMQVWSPEGFIRHRWTTADRWPHRGMWLWDTAFHAIGFRHVDCELAKDMIEAMFDVQHEDGFVPISALPDKNDYELTQPPILGIASKYVYETGKDTDWLRRVYPKLVKYLEFNTNKYDVDGLGLVSWGWGAEEYGHRPSNASGMDNSPRFDKSFELKAVDFNSYIASEYEVLSEFAAIIEKADDAQNFAEKHSRQCELINKYMWNDEQKLYMDYDSSGGKQNILLSNAGFLPLLCGAASREQAGEMIKHLNNPDTFGTAIPIATLAKSEDSYNDKDMWRGPMWVNLNWLIIRGLQRYGYVDYVQSIRHKTMQVIERYYQRYGTFFEYYDADDEMPPFFLPRKGCLNPREWIHQVIMDYGWSGTLYVDMMFDSKDN